MLFLLFIAVVLVGHQPGKVQTPSSFLPSKARKVVPKSVYFSKPFQYCLCLSLAYATQGFVCTSGNFYIVAQFSNALFIFSRCIPLMHSLGVSPGFLLVHMQNQ